MQMNDSSDKKNCSDKDEIIDQEGRYSPTFNSKIEEIQLINLSPVN